MDTANDNPLRRFSSFWLGLLLFGVFGVLSLFFGFWFNKPVEQAYDEFNTKRRLKIKSEVLESQAGARETAARSFEKVGSTLLTSTPTAVEKPEFVLPGSQTAKEAVAAGNTGIEVPEEIDEDWKLLLKGLLTRDREKRWETQQARRSLEASIKKWSNVDSWQNGHKQHHSPPHHPCPDPPPINPLPLNPPSGWLGILGYR